MTTLGLNEGQMVTLGASKGGELSVGAGLKVGLRREKTPTSGSGTEPAALMSESQDRTTGAKPRKRVESAASLGPPTNCPETLARTRPLERNIDQVDVKEEMWLGNPI